MSQHIGIDATIFPPSTQVVCQCHACGTMFANIDACPKCGSKKFASFGSGRRQDVHTDGQANNFGEGEV